MSMDVNELREVLMAALPKIQQRTDEQLAAAASSYYEPLYNAQTEAAQQAHQQSDLALSQQADQLYQPYQQSLEGIAQSTAAGTSALNRQALSRGMQRSSYTNASIGHVQQEGIKQRGLAEAQYTQSVSHINAQRAQLSQQVAQTLARLNADRAHSIAGYTDTLRQQDFQTALAGYQLLQQLELQLNQLSYQRERDQIADSQWQQQFNAVYKPSTSKSTVKKPVTTPVTPPGSNVAMGGGGGGGANVAKPS